MSAVVNIEGEIAAINSITIVNSLLEVVCSTTGMGFAAIVRVIGDRAVACAVKDNIEFGLFPGDDLKTEKGSVPSYVSVPIVTNNGEIFGALCVLDRKAVAINEVEIVKMLGLFAELFAFHLHAIEERAVKEAQLIEAKKTAELRDKFIGILGHDVRNPVGAVLNVAELLLRMPVDDRVKRMASIVQTSTQRTRGLIENILDFARAHLGEGLKLQLAEEKLLGSVLQQVVNDLPAHLIEAEFELTQAVICDSRRLAQLLSNLLSNAVKYGNNSMPIKVAARSNGDEFVLSVTNKGDKIEQHVMERLFQPFYIGDLDPTQRSLGLGLYIASEITKAHKGSLTVVSNEDFTCFTFTMKLT
ncbi:MAG: sensor histidine kinase [Bacteroidia bacterium]